MQDKMLLELLQSKPHKGIERIMKEYMGFVYAIAKTRLIGVCTLEDVEELATDVFFYLYEQRENIDLGRGSLKAWLAVITTRRAVDLYRSRIAKGTDLPLNEATLASDDLLEKQEDRAVVIDAIKKLGDPDTDILLRKLYFGQTAKEIAKIKNMSQSAVEKRISRSYVKLREILGGEAL